MSNSHKFIIWGSAGHALVIADLLKLTKGQIIALFDNRSVESVFPGIKIYYGELGFKSWLIEQGEAAKEIFGIAAIGGIGGPDRIRIHSLFRSCGITTPTLCHPSALISPTAKVGAGTQILAFANVAAHSVIGESCIVNHHASIDHECIVGNGVHLAPRATLCGCVSISDNVLIGAGAVVLPRVSIGENSVVGAGAVVAKDIPPNVKVRGVPAKSF